LNPFAAWISAKPVFIIWRGSDKSPIDPLHPNPASPEACSNAQNPATWLSWEVATAYAQSLGAGYGVGIVIHEGSGLLCVDIDGCIADGTISELGARLVREAHAACPDVYVETSMSGKGIHIIGPYAGTPPPHSTKNKELHVELYTSARYIALTGKLWPQT
jgi:primase-polymerase (primpol)-like protein